MTTSTTTQTCLPLPEEEDTLIRRCHFMSSIVHECPYTLNIMESAIPDTPKKNPLMTDDQVSLNDVL